MMHINNCHDLAMACLGDEEPTTDRLWKAFCKLLRWIDLSVQEKD